MIPINVPSNSLDAIGLLWTRMSAFGTKHSVQTDGILLYPTTDHEFELEYSSFGHNVKVAIINPNKPHQEIHKRLFGLI